MNVGRVFSNFQFGFDRRALTADRCVLQLFLTNLTTDREQPTAILPVMGGLLSAVCGQKWVKHRFQKR